MKDLIKDFVEQKRNQAYSAYDRWASHPDIKSRCIEQCLNFEAGRKKLADEILEFLQNSEENNND